MKKRSWTVLIVCTILSVTIVFAVTLFLHPDTDEKTRAIPTQAEQKSLQAAEHECKKQLGDKCLAQNIRKVSAVWGYYDQAKGDVGQYIYEMSDYTITVYISYDGNIEQVYLERI
jgi:hypothetical protein